VLRGCNNSVVRGCNNSVLRGCNDSVVRRFISVARVCNK
jgi:hypothetical protein